MKVPSLAATAALLAAQSGMGEAAGFYSSNTTRVREKKEFTHFDQERLDKAEEKRARKNAKRLAS